MPKVTVIIPNYNHERFLDKRIQSVLNQTYQDFEVIYLDDASSDNSNKVIAKFLSDKRIQTIYNQVNSGSPFKQWNKGIRQAKGEYIWLAESDDYADDRLLAELVARMDKHPTAGLAYCQSWKVDQNDNILSSWEEWTANLDENRWKKDFINKGKDECSRYLIFKNTIPNASAVLFRRSVYERVEGADEKMRVAGDWMLWAKMLLTSDIMFVAEPLNYYRTHIGAVTSNSLKGGLLLEESCQVSHYIAQNVQILPENLDKFCELTLYWWADTILYQKNVGLNRNHKIYRMLRDINPRINRQLMNPQFLKKVVKNIGSLVKQNLGLKRYLKT